MEVTKELTVVKVESKIAPPRHGRVVTEVLHTIFVGVGDGLGNTISFHADREFAEGVLPGDKMIMTFRKV